MLFVAKNGICLRENMQHRRNLTLNPIWSFAFAGAMLAALAFQPEAFAQPSLSATFLGSESGNPQWRVDVIPDASLFTAGEGSLAAEIGFTLTDSLFVDATINESVWAFANPGSNPFTGTQTFGLTLTESEAFVAFGSEPVSGPVELLTFTIAGTTGELSWGGYTIDEGEVGEFTGARVAQAGINFDEIIGSASFFVANSADCNNDGFVNGSDLQCACGNGVIDDVLMQTGLLRGDLDANGGVEFADFLVLSTNFGNSDDVEYGNGDLDCDGTVAFADFLVLSTNFGSSSAAATVPEPASDAFLPLCIAAILLSTTSRKQRN